MEQKIAPTNIGIFRKTKPVDATQTLVKKSVIVKMCGILEK